MIGVLAHALYKSALFMVAGIVDHETGTRDLRRLGGLRKAMPATFVVAAVAGLSMAGLPPLFGFLAKETLLVATTHPTLPQSIGNVMALLSVAAGALLLAQAGLLVWDTFLGRPRDPLDPRPRSALGHVAGAGHPGRAVAAPRPGAGPAVSGRLSGQCRPSRLRRPGQGLPGTVDRPECASAAVGHRHQRRPANLRLSRAGAGRVDAPRATGLGFQDIYKSVLAGIDRLAYWATRLQGGKLRTYLSIMLCSTLAAAGGRSQLEPDAAVARRLSVHAAGAGLPGRGGDPARAGHLCRGRFGHRHHLRCSAILRP